jgi:mono/diheme cytochrome c family protein
MVQLKSRLGSFMAASFRIDLVFILLLGATALGPLLHRADGQEVGDAAVGRQLAERWCSSCHVVGPTTVRGTSNGAPTFTAIARMKSTTALSLRVFLVTPHARMPDLHLTRNEIDNIGAYILSLRRE